jgi:acetyl esterase
MGTESGPDRIVTYKTVANATLKLHVFNPPDHKNSDRKPAIVFFFGGGWVGGSSAQFYGQSTYLASRGMVAICADYRILDLHGTSPKECVKDGKSAIRWVRSHADELGIDPDRVAAGGGSAGGHVAAATSTVKGFDEEDDDISVSCHPNALVLFNPVYDNGPEGCGYESVKEYWQEISPLHNLGPNTAPTTVFLGTEDILVPVATAVEYKTRMETHGVRCDLHIYEGQPHGFFNAAKFHETLLEADAFLVSLGYLTGDATLER